MPEFINKIPLPDEQKQYDHGLMCWKLPLGLAFAVHIIVFILLVMPPSFLTSHHDFQEVQTINLFTPDEIKPVKRVNRKKAPRAKIKPRVRKITPPPKQIQKTKAQSINIDDKPIPLPKPEKIVSLRPRKVKKRPPKPVKHVNKESADDAILRKALERAKARINEKKENKQIRNALSDLVKKLHTVTPPVEEPTPAEPVTHEPTTSKTSDTNNSPAKSSGPSSAAIDRAMRQYYMAISRQLHENWSLPETQNWDPSLEAIFVIVVHRNGKVSKTFFEKKSPNIYFNQYVEKTINASLPMPIFPSDIKKNQLEIGLKFRPSGMF